MNTKISLFKVHIPKTVDQPLLETLHSGFIGQGPKVEEFEQALAAFIENPRVATVNSATSGLQLALRLSNVGVGDEVISTAMTCTATNMPILAMGARIVWADVDPVTGNISPQDIERKITPKTKAILAVHWGGQPCLMAEINALAKRHNLKVIEDAAHAFGSEYLGQRIGNHSDFVVFSFQAIKHITTVDGGALFCRSEADFKRAKLLRWYGIDREEKSRSDFRCESDIADWGYKFHMNDVAATIGIEQMKVVRSLLATNRENAAYYDTELAQLPGVRLIPTSKDWASSYWVYTLHIQQRDQFMRYMADNGIMASKVHNRNDIHSTFKEFESGPLPNLDQFFSSMVCIPVGWWVSQADRELIAQTIKKFSQSSL